MAEDTQKPSPDRFASYSCVIGAFQAQIIFGLVMRAFGVIYLIILDEFQTSATVASWIGATHTLVAGISCLFTANLCQKYGCRVVAAVGCIFHCIGFLVTAFANNVYVMYVSFGVMVAIGTSCATTSAFLIVSLNFTKKRALATSLASSGSSISILFMPVLLDFLFDYYGFQGCMAILGGISLQGLVSAALYGSHKSMTKKTQKPEVNSSGKTDSTNQPPVKFLNNGSETNNNNALLAITSRPDGGVQNEAFNSVEEPQRAFDSKESMFDEGKRKSFVDLSVPRRSSKHIENAFDSREFMFEEEIHTPRLKRRSIAWKTTAQLAISTQYNAPNKRDICSSPRSIQIIKENPLVIGIILVNFSTTFVATSMGTFIPAYAMERGHSLAASLLLITWSGAASTIGRISLGFLLDSKPVKSNRLWIYFFCALLSGVTALLTPLMSPYWWLCFTSSLCGAFIGTVFVQRTTVLADQVGMQRLPVMFGLVQTLNSIGFTLSTGFGGVMRDLMGTYTYYYYMAGCISLVTTTTVLLIAAIKHRKHTPANQ